MRILTSLSSFPLAMFLFLASAAAPAHAADSIIIIKKFMFNPMDVTVPAGTNVTWENEDGEPHTVVSLTNDFRSQALDEKDKFSHTLRRPRHLQIYLFDPPQDGGHDHCRGEIALTPKRP